MKKNGFTLSEILLTMGIIGVIAAISISLLVKNTQKAHVGPSLAKFVGNFETAVQTVMQKEGINSLAENTDYTGGADGCKNLINAVDEYMKLVPYVNDDKDDYADNEDVYIATLSVNGKSVYQTKEGFLVYVMGSNFIMIDINGIRKPNKPGLDRFLFYLDSSGKLLPWGKSKLYYNRLKAALGGPIDYYPSDCDVNSQNPWNGYACTGKIADNGWKAD